MNTKRRLNTNTDLLEAAVEKLGPLVHDLVFVGGCATELLITDVAAAPVRQTIDVDVLTEASSLRAYYTLADKLREQGFSEDRSENAPICRWLTDNVILDVMPLDPDILGFSNSWYKQANHYAEQITLPSGVEIFVVTSPYFLATKLEAFEGRGNGDFLSSHDIEDLIAVLDGRIEVVEEILDADSAVRLHLQEKFQSLLSNPSFMQSLQGHLLGDKASQSRFPILLERIREISSSN